MQNLSNENTEGHIVGGKQYSECSKSKDIPVETSYRSYLRSREPLRPPRSTTSTTSFPPTAERGGASSRSPGRPACRVDPVYPVATSNTAEQTGARAAADARRTSASPQAATESRDTSDEMEHGADTEENGDDDGNDKSKQNEMPTPIARSASARQGCRTPQLDSSGSVSGSTTQPPFPADIDKSGDADGQRLSRNRGKSSDLVAYMGWLKLGSQSDQLKAVVILALVVLCAWWAYRWEAPLPLVRVDSAARPLPASVHRWVEQVVLLSARFPYQQPWLWKVTRATVNRMLLQGVQPAVLLVTAGEQQRAEADCLLAALTTAVRNATDSAAAPQLRLDGRRLAQLHAEQAKGQLGAALDSLRPTAGSDGDTAVVVLTDLQRLRPHTAMLLHGFCDNENAPRKAAVFLLLLVTPQPPPAADLSLQKAAEQQLWLAWGDTLGEDIFDALMSRIAGNVVAVAAEGNPLICPQQTYG